ncbi:hypothetical protein ILUMI_05653 [Ignelater luminosus]|uniref:Uncharacterized protein n=1 Tax=Ignelater luminosus TaxID=2038154 RepID=A0A8K0DBV4_IGNLU|nr:hypothetical protein ILUMI_05653 [Ignelater luminosus]
MIKKSLAEITVDSLATIFTPFGSSCNSRLLGKGNINLETAEQICRSSEVTKTQARDLQGEKVDAIRNEQKYMRGGCGKNTSREVKKLRMNMTA